MRHGIRGTGAATLAALVASGTAIHYRYELRGTVKLNDILVPRQVRIYRRSTGELAATVDATFGTWKTHVSLDPAEEFYAVAIDTGADAVDFAPPISNRLTGCLADDNA
jgi:hypothetical protein